MGTTTVRGRVALVTGASRGIGAAIAHPHLPGSLAETVRAIEHRGGRAVPIVADVSDPQGRAHIVPEAEAALGPIDVLVNNAAAALERFTAGLAAAVWEDGIAVNALAPVVAVRTPGTEALGMLLEDLGRTPRLDPEARR